MTAQEFWTKQRMLRYLMFSISWVICWYITSMYICRTQGDVECAFNSVFLAYTFPLMSGLAVVLDLLGGKYKMKHERLLIFLSLTAPIWFLSIFVFNGTFGKWTVLFSVWLAELTNKILF